MSEPPLEISWSWIGRMLDRSIVGSFDITGFMRHERRFPALSLRPLPRPVIVTGGTAGIGLAAAERLSSLGARVELWGRNAQRGADAAVRAGGTYRAVDLGDLEQVAKVARAIEEAPSGLVLNAGAMPLDRTLTAQGHELMWGSQVLGHLLLLRILRQRGLLGEGCRVVWVSSGGMYAQRLDLRDLRCDRRYQRHTAYANVKRAQVMLNARLAEAWPDVWTAAMHPGWVDTAAVRRGMPLFRTVMAPVLRSPKEGADTLWWLVAERDPLETGHFWFDRHRQPLHLSDRTRRSEAQAEELWERVLADTAPFLGDS